jgi:hypothetical protein
VAHGNTEQFEQAWKTYYATIEELRGKIYALDWMTRPGARDAAHYYLLQVQATAFNMAIGSRRDYPTLSVHTTYAPILYSLSNHSADFNVRFGLVDGQRSYRLWGKRNGSCFIDIQINTVLWGTPDAKKLGNYDVDDFVDANGNFEFILSAEPHPGNWIRLERASKDNLVLLREAFDDWEQPRAEINIQMVEDGRAGDIALGEDELTRRLQLATDYVRFYAWDWSTELTNRVLAEAGTNAFHHGIFASNQGAGNNPSASYPGAVYDLSEHEAIVVETDLPKARYWNVQLADPMWQVIDFTYHHSSINNYQAHINSDGRLRVIVSRLDPGIGNWLDPVDNPFGIVFFRFYRADRRVEPNISFVGSLDEALKTIPADTPRISSLQRKEAMTRRTAAARQRFRD